MELDKIKAILSDLMSADIDGLVESTHFTKDLGMDSLDIYQLAAELEDAFNIDIPEDAFKKFKTIGDAVKYISGNI